MPTCPQCRTEFPAEVLVCPVDGTALAGVRGELAEPAAATSAASDSPPAPSAAPAPPDDPLVGALIAGRYFITGRLGEGGMGVVYAARHALLGKTVAVKVLRDKYRQRPELAARLMNEARLASSIAHAHIVDVYDFGEIADGRTFVVMEQLDGVSLAELLRREGPLSEARVIAIGLQIAGALGAAHARGIVHRDVKPENLFVTRREGVDFVKVVDFGISRLLESGSEPNIERLTETGVLLGTPHYMSPEQARGQEDLDHRVDVYALGVILYECLTGEVPFRGTNQLGVLDQVVHQEVVPPRQLRPELGLSEGMQRVVLKALAKTRDARYASMDELSADLQRVRDGKVVLPLVLPADRATRRKIFVRVLIPVLTALAGVALATVFLRSRRPLPSMAATATLTTPRPVAATTLQSPLSAPPVRSPTVKLALMSQPSGAEVWNGVRRLGNTPLEVELPRSSQPLQLRFHLTGFEDGLLPLVPQVDGDKVHVELHPLKKVRRRIVSPEPSLLLPRKKRRPPETAPNPY